MILLTIATLLVIIVVQLGMLLVRTRKALVVLAATKIHVREGKEEQWQEMHAIRRILLAHAEVDGRIDAETLSRLHDTPEQLGEDGRWRHHMPANYLELYWRNQPLPEKPAVPPHNGGQFEAHKRVLFEADLL